VNSGLRTCRRRIDSSCRNTRISSSLERSPRPNSTASANRRQARTYTNDMTKNNLQRTGNADPTPTSTATQCLSDRVCAPHGLRLRQSLGLQPDQTITQRMTSGGISVRRDDPVIAEIAARRTRARIFNSAQPKLRVQIDPDELKRLIEDGFRSELEDARELRGRLPFLSRGADVGPTTLWMLIVLDEPSTRWVAGARGMVWYAEGPSQGHSDRVEIECVTGEADEGEWLYAVDPQMFRSRFPEAPGAGNADLHYKICRYLRHHPDDVEFVWPETACSLLGSK
jgi:hypothetical protein